MKRVAFMLFVIVALAGVMSAQQGKDSKAPAGTQAQPAQQAQTQQPAAKAGPQAKTQEELKAYQDAAAIADPAAADKAADEFAAKYKDSQLRYLLYYRTMLMYQSQNNAEKAIDSGRRLLAINPNEPATLAIVASLLSMKTRDTDLDRDDRLNEAMQDAQKSLQNIDTEMMAQPGATPEQLDQMKNYLRSLAYGAMGGVYSNRNDFANAESNLKKAIDLNTLQPDAVSYLQYAIALERQKKFQEALLAANKALDLSPADSPQANLAKQERQHLLKLTSSAAPAPTATTQAPPK
jgi:tetratricopeptide (TPR) repeat protein